MHSFTYDDFVEKVNELGFISSSNGIAKGFPCINDFVPETQWWTGDPDLDPWGWKDRAAGEKKLAYGTFFENKKGFIAPGYYSIFLDAFHPAKTMEERQEAGILGKYEWLLWQLLGKENRPLGTHEYRAMLGVTAKTGQSSLNTAVTNMQLTFDIALTGKVDMVDKNGIPYNTSVGCDKMENWVPAEWLVLNPRMQHLEALETIYQRAQQISRGADQESIKKVFSKQLKLYRKIENG